jgi:1-acyl-sn-glycerol-3-phosphate acyltransferase
MVKILSTYIVMPIVWVLIGVSSFAFFIVDALVWILTFWWDKKLWFLHRYSIVWSLFYIWINPFWKIDIKGEENIDKKKPYIIISNHQSAFDIVLLYRLWMHFKWVAKRELFRIPVIGWNLWLNKHIAIDRASVRGARKMITEAQNHLNMGSSVLIFPEGTRTIDGTIKRFKDGAFVLAKKTGYPILPVVIDGSMEVIPKNGYTIKGSQTFTMRVLPEISPDFYQNMDVDQLAQEMHKLFTETHKKIAPKYYAHKE